MNDKLVFKLPFGLGLFPIEVAVLMQKYMQAKYWSTFALQAALDTDLSFMELSYAIELRTK